jgi:LysR family hydrogen peroxide-inducible transcriptional activator
VPVSNDIRLLPFQGDAPHRRIAMVWRRSSAMSGFLQQLAGELRKLPQALLLPPDATVAAPAGRKRASANRASA